MPRGFQVGVNPKQSARLAYSVYAGELFRWNASCVSMDINFEVLLEPPDLNVADEAAGHAPAAVPRTEVVLAMTRIKPKATNSGRYVAPRDGKVALNFHNCDGLITLLEKKQVKGDVSWFILTNKVLHF